MGLNKVMMAGIVSEEPQYHTDSIYGNALEIKLSIHRRDIDKNEQLTCFIINDNVIERARNEIRIGDYLISQSARLVNLKYKATHDYTCPCCGKIESRSRRIETTDIILYEYDVIHDVSLEKSIGINKVTLLGKIPFDPVFYPDEETGITWRSNFKLAINRPIGVENRLKDSIMYSQAKIDEIDSPSVVAFGKNALKVEQRVYKGLFMTVEGSIQERPNCIEIPIRCKGCNESTVHTLEFPVRQIVAAKINMCDYLIRNIESHSIFETIYQNL